MLRLSGHYRPGPSVVVGSLVEYRIFIRLTQNEIARYFPFIPHKLREASV